KADDGCPLKSAQNLSISSKTKTGLEVPALLSDWIKRPGIAPIYVFRCPRILASSRIQPNAIGVYFLPNAFATDFPKDVFPTPGGPTKQRIGAFMSFLSFNTARYSIIRCLTFSNP